MSNIVTKLNLNRTPNIVENNSMVFAKNIRVDIDGTIHKDYSINPMSIQQYVGYDLFYDDIVHRIIGDYETIINDTNSDQGLVECTTYFLNKIKTIINYSSDVTDYKDGTFYIVDIIANSNEFYLFINGVYTTQVEGAAEVTHQENMIICYDEAQDLFYPCNCKWTYSGGNIDGCVINNLLGEKILNIGENNAAGSSVPLKCINLNKSKYTDDERIYTQSPNVPITNLGYSGVFTYTIPNGVYQFFVRYKIREEFYTNWFPVSKELYAGNKNTTATNYGTLGFINTHLDSDKSFIFTVEHLYPEYESNYESFQIGFILSHDDAIYGRAWKHFTFDQNIIKFDYVATDAEEIDVTELTKATYQLYNVGNITSFKNKLYISNYTETDFNEDLQTYADKIKIELAEKTANSGYGDYPVVSTDIGSKSYITAFTLDTGNVTITGEKGLIYNMLNDADSGTTPISIIQDAAKETQNTIYDATSNKYGLQLNVHKSSLNVEQSYTRNKYSSSYGVDFYSLTFKDNTPTKYSVNDTTVISIDAAIAKIYNTIKYLNENAIFLDANRQIATSFKILVYRTAELKYYTYSPTPLIDDDTLKITDSTKKSITISDSSSTIIIPTKNLITTNVTYTQTVTVYVTANKSKLTSENTDDLINYTTLIPYQKYKFYVHFVKNTGEISNGYYCGGSDAGIKTVSYKEACNAIIYPKFSNIYVPSGYCACFFSILHYAINTSTIFNVTAAKNESGDAVIAYEGSCIETNIRLAPSSSGIEIRQNDTILTGEYYHSSNAAVIRYFGANGVIYINKDLDVDVSSDKRLYITSDYESTQEKDATLIKCTPYIRAAVKIESTGHLSPIATLATSFDNCSDLNLLGFICQVYDIDRTRSIEYYSDGSNVYHKNNIYNVNNEGSALNIDFTELGQYTDSTYKIPEVGLLTTPKTNIYSNYNFNYLALNEEPKQVIKTYYNYSSTETPTKSTSYSILWRLLTSLTLSETYTLPSMYKSFTRRIFVPYNKDEIIYFNNTVRSSMLEGDEARVSIFKFDAEDYYNIPTNRGIIVNLISIGDSILVHTKDSMFKFTGSNSLQSSSGEIQTNESEVFNTGVSEVFGSDFGFAGIQYKDDCIITENGYIFFDRDSLIVYMYSGNGQIVKLSDSIEKLFRRDTITNIRFANDYYNNRFFMCIWFGKSYVTSKLPVTLSFCVNENIKSFVSLHDFAFNKAFNTKTRCYFLTTDATDICTIDKNRFGEYYKLEINSDYTDIVYPSKHEVRERYVKKYQQTDMIPINIPTFYSIVDIIENTRYENIKTLNTLNWCSRYVLNEFPDVGDQTYNMAEGNQDVYPCSQLKIYTDECVTKDLDLSDIANAYSITNPDSYKYPRYNQGYWSLNYFRNINNANNVFRYLGNPTGTNPTYTDGRDVPGVTPEYRSDENSLMEGKYFVARFIFDALHDFKLETINFNYNVKL